MKHHLLALGVAIFVGAYTGAIVTIQTLQSLDMLRDPRA